MKCGLTDEGLLNVAANALRCSRGRAIGEKIPEDIPDSVTDGAGRVTGGICEVGMIDTAVNVFGLKAATTNESLGTPNYFWDAAFVVPEGVTRPFEWLRLDRPTYVDSKATNRTVEINYDRYWDDTYFVHIAATQAAHQLSRCDRFLFSSLKWKSSRRINDKLVYDVPEFIQLLGTFDATAVRDVFYFRKRGQCGDHGDNKPAEWDEFYYPINKLDKLFPVLSVPPKKVSFETPAGFSRLSTWTR